jgi:hypothetical protein
MRPDEIIAAKERKGIRNLIDGQVACRHAPSPQVLFRQRRSPFRRRKLVVNFIQTSSGMSIVSRATPKGPEETHMDTTTLLIIVVLIVLLGGGGWYGRGRWY